MAGQSLRNRQGIFISYRRSDSGPWTGRLADDLRTYFGRERVYLDLDSNRAARDYIVQIDEFLDGARVAIAVIGPRWLDVEDSHGQRRIDHPQDLVRQELETALSSGVALVPVYVGGAVPPSPDQLPTSLRPISTIHATRMSDQDWDYDLGRLLETIERHGLIAADEPGEVTTDGWRPTKERHYTRTVRASRRRALDAAVGAAESLGYKDRRVYAEAAKVTFRVARRLITVEITDAGPGESTIRVQYPTVRTGLLAAGAAVATVSSLGFAAAAWPALRLWERRFAIGFLNNVQAVLEGRGVGEDSAVPRGISDWRNRSREV